MNLEMLIKTSNYNEALNNMASRLDQLNKKEIELLKRLLLFCGIDFISTYKNEKYENNINNPFFMKNDKLNLIKTILDSNTEIFYYLYLNINNDDYIEKELEKYNDYFSDIIFLRKNIFYNDHKLENQLQEDGIIQIQNFLEDSVINKLRAVTLDYMKKTNLSVYLFNENRSRVFLTEKHQADVLSIFKNLVSCTDIEGLLKKYINMDVECNFIQLELMEKAPVQTTKIKHWHLDNLSDQFKVFIPLVDVNEDNAPMNYIPGTHLIKNLNSEMKNYLHYIFRMSGVVTTPTTGIPNYIVDNMKSKESKGIIKAGDIAIFNTALAHTGSFVQSDIPRLNMVLVFNSLSTNRNILFKQLKTFY